jgi:hypothetical protein
VKLAKAQSLIQWPIEILTKPKNYVILYSDFHIQY